MEKVLMVLLAATITLTSTIPAFAVDTTPKENNKKYAASEKVNKNALNHYKQQSEQFSQSYIDYLNKTAKSITNGISGDYDKTKAISTYVSENIWYDEDLRYDKKSVGKVNYFNPNDDGNRGSAGFEIIAGDKTECEGYAAFTVSLLRAVGIPAKEVWGHFGSASHAWVLAYVDGNWLFTDPTFASQNKVYKGEWSKPKASSSDYFDWSYDRWSLVYNADDEATSIVNTDLNGKLWFYSTYHGTIQNLIKQVDTDLSAGDKLNSTYGFEAKDLYKDALCTKPWDMDKDVVTEADTLIYIKNYKPHQTADTTTTTTADTTADTNTSTATTDTTTPTTDTTTTTTPAKTTPTPIITGWSNTDGNWRYYSALGYMVKSSWFNYKGNWYHLGADGVMSTGWLKDYKNWYYLYSDGSRAHDTVIDGYTLDANGVWIN